MNKSFNIALIAAVAAARGGDLSMLKSKIANATPTLDGTSNIG